MPIRFRRPGVPCAIAAGVLLALPAGAAAQVRPAPTMKGATTELRQALPGDGSVRKSILGRLSTANAALKRGDACDARSALAGIRSLALRPTGSGKPDTGQRAAIAAASLQAESLVLFRKGASSCGGADTAPAKRLVRKVVSQSPSQVTVDLRFPAPSFEGAEGNNTPYVGLAMEDFGGRGAVGEPATPAMSQLVAVPQGAKVGLKVLDTDGVTLSDVDLQPEQEPGLEQAPATEPPPPGTGRFDDPAFRGPGFRRDGGAYAARRPFPGRLVAPTQLGNMRGLQLATLDVAGGQYVPKLRKLRVLTRVRYQVTFTGGTGKFADQRITLPDEQELLKALAPNIVNIAAVGKAVGQNPQLQKCGEHMLLFADPALRAAADRYANARTAAGVVTRVFSVGENGLTSAEAIRQFTMSRIFSSCERRPSHVLLFGDVPAVPTFKPKLETRDQHAPTDFPFGLLNTSIFIPAASVGRIPVRNAAEADAVVTKLTGFAAAPPTDPAFYNKASVAGFFQIREDGAIVHGPQRENRTFIEDGERARSALVARGKTVDRFYTKETGATPLQFNNGSLLPAALLPPFGWNNTGEQIRNAFNEGRFLFFHRDHGFWGGWGDPHFDIQGGGAALPAGMTNGNRLPLVLSVNCSSGRFDLDGGANSFAESLLLDQDGGAFAVIAASRDTWTPTNSPFSRGLANAITGGMVWPGSGVFTPLLNLGQMLYYGKIQMALRTSSDSKYVRDTMRMFNLFGDPSMRLKITP